jgi:hypothetical protein
LNNYQPYKNPFHDFTIYTYSHPTKEAISTLAILGVAFTNGLSSWFFGVSGVLTALFAIAFWVLLPKE